MKWLLLIAGVLMVLVVVVVVVGTMLPQKHVAFRSAEFKQSPSAIWEAITKVGAFPSWRNGVKSVEELSSQDGHRSWRETSSDGAITFEVLQAEPQQLLVTKIVDRSLPFGGSWTYEISPSGTGSILKITENGEVYNVVFRFMSRFVFGHTATIETYLKALGRKFGETVEVR